MWTVRSRLGGHQESCKAIMHATRRQGDRLNPFKLAVTALSGAPNIGSGVNDPAVAYS
jgi:hypothetical protein